MRSVALILHPVHYSQAIFYTVHPKVDASFSGGPTEEIRGHVSNIDFSEANEIIECLQSAFIAYAVAVALRSKPTPIKALVDWVPCRLRRSHNYRYILSHTKINGAVLA